MASETDEAVFPPKETIPFLAPILARLTTAHYMCLVDDQDLTPPQAYALRELLVTGAMSQVELGRRLEIGKVSIGETLSRLEESGLISRQRLEADRRVMMVCLTDKGRAMRKHLASAARDQVEEIEKLLGRKANAEFVSTLVHLVDRLRACTKTV